MTQAQIQLDALRVRCTDFVTKFDEAVQQMNTADQEKYDHLPDLINLTLMKDDWSSRIDAVMRTVEERMPYVGHPWVSLRREAIGIAIASKKVVRRWVIQRSGTFGGGNWSDGYCGVLGLQPMKEGLMYEFTGNPMEVTVYDSERDAVRVMEHLQCRHPECSFKVIPSLL